MAGSEQGVDYPKYKVIPRSLIFLFDQHGRLLLLKGAADKRLWAGKYNGIGGHVEPGESVMESALRELEEEAGIEGVDLWLCAQIMVTVTARQGVALFVFKGLVKEVTLTASGEGALEWIDFQRLEGLPVMEDLMVLLPKVIAHKRSDAVLFGESHYDHHDRLVVAFR